jgi:hypothetical protein
MASATDWITPNSLGSGDYDVRYTGLTGDALTSESSAADAWIALSGARTYLLTRAGIGISSCTLTFEIRDPGGTTVASTAKTFTAEVDSGA